MTRDLERQRTIAVYGATGYTGRRVAFELIARGCRVLLAGRDVEKLTAVAAELGDEACVVVVGLADASALRALTARAAAVVNCAGPFSGSVRAVARAAIASGCHYLDVSAEQGSAKSLCDDHDRDARAAGVVLLPAYAFYTAVSDALATVVAEELGAIEDVTVAYRVGDWRPPAASFRSRIEGLGREWFVYDGGLESVHAWPATTWFDFGRDIGKRRMTAYPTADVILLPRHLRARRVDARLTAETLAPRRLGWLLPWVANAARLLSATPAMRIVEAVLALLWRSSRPRVSTAALNDDPTTFDVVVSARRDGLERRARASGRGIYELTARLVADAAVRVSAAAPERCGVRSPAEHLGARVLLRDLAAHGVACEIEPVTRVVTPIARAGGLLDGSRAGTV